MNIEELIKELEFLKKWFWNLPIKFMEIEKDKKIYSDINIEFWWWNIENFTITKK